MKKTIIIASLLMVAAGCNTAPTSTQNQQQTSSAPQLQTYQNGTYGFEFQYPQNMVFVTPNYANLQDKIVEVSIPQTDYPKTNFGDAAFSVSASFARSLASCLAMNAPENGDGFKTKTQINGQTFYMSPGSGVGAGNLYESKIYRTLSGNQTCIELNETLHTANIGNFPAGTVTAVDKNVVWSRLDAVLTTFKLK